MNCAFIQGFSPVLPILTIVVFTLVSLFLSWWSYQHLASIPALKRYSLIILRAASFFILLLLLLNPFIIRQESDQENPKVAVFIDNSQSMSVERGNYSGMENYADLIEQFRSAETSDFEYDYFLFDDEVDSFDELTLNGFRTNLDRLIEYVRERETEYSGSVIFSDGIITHGRNPVFASQNLSIPLITIPVGDTSDVRDIAITDVDFIQTVYSQTRQTFTAEIQQQGFEGEETSVQLIKDGSLIETKTLSFTAETSSQTVEFDQEFTDPGFFNYEIQVPVKDDEFTGQNNHSQFTIEVLEDKTNILSLAFEIHPDVGSVRKIIATDQQHELFSSLYLNDDRFIGSDPRQLDEEMDLIVLHGLPEVNSTMFEWIKDQQTSILYFATPNSFSLLQNDAITDLTAYHITSVEQQLINVQMEPFQSSVSHPILELQSAAVQRFPTLQIYRGEFRLSPLAQPLIRGSFRTIETDIPLLIAEDAALHRRASLTGFGWYRFEQSQNSEIRNFFEQLITNLVSWTSTSPDRENLQIEPTKTIFSESETVALQATLFNERGEPEPDAVIELEVEYEEDSGEDIFRMTHRQNESYYAEIGNYPQGMYRIQATAVKNNRTIGTAETRVHVSQSSAEFLNTKRNDALLNRLAEFTDGIFIEDQDMTRAHEFIQNSETVIRANQINEEIVYIHQSALWFFVVLILLSVEWIVRRTVSLP